MNVLRVTLHPDGLAPRIRNYDQWRAHTARRIRRQLERTAAPGLAELLAEVEAFPPQPDGKVDASELAGGDLVLPMILSSDAGELRFCYALTVSARRGT